MFKLNKNTHMMILMTFTVVFVVVYMYYAIRDIKVIYSDVKKMEADITTLKTKQEALENETKVIKQLISSVPPPQQQPMPMQEVFEMVFPVPKMPVTQHAVIVQEEDNDSVSTEDIKKLVPDDEEEPEQPTLETPEPVAEAVKELEPVIESQEEPVKTYSEDELKKMKFEEVKDICKKMNVNTKGSKEVLISRILSEKNIS